MDSLVLLSFILVLCLTGSFAQQSVTAVSGSCYPPPTVANAVYSPAQRVYQVGTTITFTCRTGFTLTAISSTTAQCHVLANRRTTWRLEDQKTAPVCRSISTQVPVVPLNPSTACGGSCPFNSVCGKYNNMDTCVCNNGYFFSNGICHSRSWAKKITCRTPSCPPNSDPHLFQGTYVHICKPTHFLFGSTCVPRTLEVGGGLPLLCERPTVAAGVFIFASPNKTSWAPGETIIYSCLRNMIITPHNHNRAICGSEGRFNTPPPTCRMQPLIQRFRTNNLQG
uniref:Sushi domain-containing protein n=1 Tax=Ciona savignyi TaxID=51511 RepID=H2Z9X7_CIOSA